MAGRHFKRYEYIFMGDNDIKILKHPFWKGVYFK